MKKIGLTLIMIGYALLFPIKTYPFSQIYDEKNGKIYIGGETLEMKRFEIDKLRPRLAWTIFEIDVKENKSKALIKTTKPIYIYEISRKGYIAVSVAGKDEGAKEKTTSLIIYDGHGKELKAIKDVPALLEHKYFSWSKDGGRIAFIKGKMAEYARLSFDSEGVFVYDVEKDEVKNIRNEGENVIWSRHDNNIYIQGWPDDTRSVYIFNSAAGNLMKSDKKGLIFSDDSRYCVGYESKREKVEFNRKLIDKTMIRYFVYDNATNKPFHQFKIGKDLGQEEWAGDATFISASHNLLMWDYLGGHRIFDVDKKSFIRVSATSMLGWNEDMAKIVVYEKGGKQVYIEDLMTGKRLQSVNIPE